MNHTTAIETKDLTKAYQNFVAVDKLNLRVEDGESFGFLGPNGAGKTTTILMLLGLTEPTSGFASVCGYNPTREPVKVKRIVGYMPEKVGFYEDMTARENLEYTAWLNDIPDSGISTKVKDVLSMVGLTDSIEQKVGKFSHGMKQRLGIADVMVKEPKVAFFDEPTSGIDPEGIEQILTLIKEMAKMKVTIILSSHQLHQVQKICTRVGILSKGRLVADGALENLGRETLSGGKYRIHVQVTQPSSNLVDSIKSISGVQDVDVTGDLLIVNCDEDLRPQLARTVVDSNCLLVQMKIEEYGLEEIYMKYFHEKNQ
jgi:ABC-2 type transport system ATP-binding protein